MPDRAAPPHTWKSSAVQNPCATHAKPAAAHADTIIDPIRMRLASMRSLSAARSGTQSM
jgi:hypothetical protein